MSDSTDKEKYPKGLVVCELSDVDFDELIEHIDKCEWSNEITRRVQHYGFKYDYKTRKVSPGSPIPSLFSDLINILKENEVIDPNQIIVNEYLSGQYISRHIDSDVFGPVVVTLSLGDGTTFQMSNRAEVVDIPVKQGSLLILEGESRSKWYHCTLPVHKEGFRRISITFRTVK